MERTLAMQTSNHARMEFHISREARDRYQLQDNLFSLSGSVILANFHAARMLAERMNEQRDLARHPEKAIRAGQINTMGLIDEILHFVADRYREERNPQAMKQALDWLDAKAGRE